VAGERTEQATQQRRDKARREGDLLHSREFSAAAGTVAGAMVLGVAGPRFVAGWTDALGAFLSYGAIAAWEPEAMDKTMKSLLSLAVVVLMPVGLVGTAVVAAALGIGVLQTGGIQLHPGVLSFKLDRINPLSNLKGLFSLRSAARLGKSMIPAALLAIFAVQRLARQWDMPAFSSARLVALGGDTYSLLLAAAWLLFAWAAIDYLVEWQSREQRLKMSRQEMREEYEESEGNPHIRGRIRNLRKQARRRRTQGDVSKAAVVITNPTHYAVALEFDFQAMDAPRVVAKGKNILAEEIKDKARWAGVPILENPPLARSLYRAVEAGESIPVELYAAVASILAFLYRQRVGTEIRQRRQRDDRSESSPGEMTVARPPTNRRGSASASSSTTSAGRGPGMIRGMDRRVRTDPGYAARGAEEKNAGAETRIQLPPIGGGK
jgi:flagellar biosynthesis protein FlhB